jgi:ribulose-5-phosphate 4-epimerase/fuculose-1-phosphate aldolase
MLVRAGLSRGFGHVSARVPTEEGFLITPAVALDELVANEIELADRRGIIAEPRSVAGGPAEIHLHAAVYGARPDIAALVRVQPEFVEAFGVAGVAIRPLNNFGAALLGPSRLLDAVGSVNTAERGAAAARALGDGVVLVLRGNGCLVAGADVRTATVRACWLEEAARLQLRAATIAPAAGGPSRPTFLTDAEVVEIGERLSHPTQIERTWNALLRGSASVVAKRPRPR